MSLAPASSRGAFLKARLAVNGIQCAARSFGTLTAGALGLLSSIGASSDGSDDTARAESYQLRPVTGTPITCKVWAQSGALLRTTSDKVGRGDPEHLALRIFAVEPEQRQL